VEEELAGRIDLVALVSRQKTVHSRRLLPQQHHLIVPAGSFNGSAPSATGWALTTLLVVGYTGLVRQE
jgi:hypothetical protein